VAFSLSAHFIEAALTKGEAVAVLWACVGYGSFVAPPASPASYCSCCRQSHGCFI
jgi:hypothetical protein